MQLAGPYFALLVGLGLVEIDVRRGGAYSRIWRAFTSNCNREPPRPPNQGFPSASNPPRAGVESCDGLCNSRSLPVRVSISSMVSPACAAAPPAAGPEVPVVRDDVVVGIGEIDGERNALQQLAGLRIEFLDRRLRANQMPPSGPIEKLPTPGVFGGSRPAMGILMKVSLAGSNRTTVCAQFSDIHTMSWASTVMR